MTTGKIYQMVKVIEPHAKDFPKEAKELIFKIGKDWDLVNNSFIDWCVGDYATQKKSHPDDIHLLRLDQLLIEGGCEVGEKLLIKFWW